MSRAAAVVAGLRAAAPSIAFALAFRFACYAAMTALALWAELRPAPTLPDLFVAHVPYVAWVDRLNYLAWLFIYVPVAAAFLVSEPPRWTRYMVTGGLVSLARGVCIALTGLGPPDAAHAGSGVTGHTYWQAFAELLSPVDIFAKGAAKAYLTQDLFFSGHTATTFLLVLYLWQRPRLRWVALAGHVAVVTTVVFAHLHYAIDIAGAYAFTFSFYAWREWAPRAAAR